MKLGESGIKYLVVQYLGLKEYTLVNAELESFLFPFNINIVLYIKSGELKTVI